MYSPFYEPTEQDLQDWHRHCLTMAMEDLAEQEDYFDLEPDDEYEGEDYYDDDIPDNEADAMTLRDAGMGTDEDYGLFSYDDEF